MEHDGLYRRHAADREVVDAAGVAVIVIGAVISTGAAAVRLAHHETGTYRRFRQQLGQTILLGLGCWSPETSSAPSPPSPPSAA
jgi:hypothetical protein